MTDEIIDKARSLANHAAPWDDESTAEICRGFRALDEKYLPALTALDAACELLAAVKASMEPSEKLSKWTRLERAIKEFERTEYMVNPPKEPPKEPESREDSDGQTHTWPRR